MNGNKLVLLLHLLKFGHVLKLSAIRTHAAIPRINISVSLKLIHFVYHSACLTPCLLTLFVSL